MNLEQSKANNGQERILVIIGPTGSGKTGLAIDVALELARLRGVDVAAEVISADSRAIYKGMDIGTAKPTREEMQGVPHWGIDLVEPDERFTVVDFCDYARQKIAEIRKRGHLPIIAGGTGLYVDALVYDYHFFCHGNFAKSFFRRIKKFVTFITNKFFFCLCFINFYPFFQSFIH